MSLTLWVHFPILHLKGTVVRKSRLLPSVWRGTSVPLYTRILVVKNGMVRQTSADREARIAKQAKNKN